MEKNVATLIVNDAQLMCLPDAAEQQTYEPLQAVLGEISTAISKGDGIALVCYEEMGPICAAVMRAVRGYARVRIVLKSDWNGAHAILTACREAQFPTTNFRICGFYTHRCVQSTVRGITVLSPEAGITVVKAACDDPSENRWSSFPRLPNVTFA